MPDVIVKWIDGEKIEFHKSKDRDAPGWFTTIGNQKFRLNKVHRSGWYAFNRRQRALVGASTMSKVVIKLLLRRDKGMLEEV